MTSPPTIRITVNGKLALTVGQAAARYGRTPGAMRMLLHRLAVEPVETLDGRTPLFAAAPLDKLMRDLPGRGRRR